MEHEVAGNGPRLREALSGYLRETRSPGYTLFLVLPFTVFYEAGLAVFHRRDASLDIRNGADAILRGLFFPHWLEDRGRAAVLLWGAFGVLVLMAAVVVWGRGRGGGWRVRTSYLLGCFAEAFGWALLLFLGWVVMVSLGMEYLVDASQKVGGTGGGELGFGLEVVLACGAGVYEELLFRLILVGVLELLFRGVAGMSRAGAGVSAVVMGALLFALAHYLGPQESFDGSSVAYLKFVFRFGAGLFFSGLLSLRSFGTAVAAHAFYDIIVAGVRGMAGG